MTARPIGVEVSCDGPTGHDDCPSNAAVRARYTSRTAAQVRADGREDGWTRHAGRDLCPDCTTASKEAQP